MPSEWLVTAAPMQPVAGAESGESKEIVYLYLKFDKPHGSVTCYYGFVGLREGILLLIKLQQNGLP